MSPLLLAVAAMLLAALSNLATAEPSLRGQPLLQRFTAEDFPAAPAHLGIAVDPRGVVHVGNVEGVLRFAGGSWELFELPGRSPARSLLRARDGRIYVGGYDRFGVLDTLPTGDLSYTDLRHRFGLAGADAHVGDVWDVLETPAGIFFRAARALYFLGYDGATRQWPLPEEARGFTAVGDALYTRVEGIGVTRFEDGRLVPLRGAGIFAHSPLIHVAEHADGLLLAGRDGFHIATAQGIERRPSAADAVFSRHPPYTSKRLPDGSIVFGTTDGVVIHVGPDLSLLDEVPLVPYSVSGFAIDLEGGLWVATEGDLLRLRMPSPWTAFTDAHGLRGSPADSAWHDGTLWVATSLDVYRAQRDAAGEVRFLPQRWTQLEAFDLESTEAGLLIAERHGVQVLDPGASTPRRLADAESAFRLRRSPHHPGQVWVTGEHELLLLGLRQQRWQLVSRWSLEGASVDGVEPVAPDELWLGDLRGPPQRWRLDPDDGRLTERTRFGPESGIRPDPDQGSTIIVLDDTLFAIVGDDVHRFDGTAFKPYRGAPFDAVQRPMELSVRHTAIGTFAWTSRTMLLRATHQTEWKPLQLGSRLARGFVDAQLDADGMLRLITWNAVLQFDTRQPEPELPPLRAGLERLELRSDGQPPQPLPIDGSAPQTLPAGAGLYARLGLISMEPGTEFRYRMRGLTDEWTEWRREREVYFRTLPQRRYTFEVEARSASGRLAEPFRHAFRVEPHWYQTPWAWLLALLVVLLVLGALAHVIAQVRYRQYVATNRRLERKISERTAELETVNRKLSELATEDGLTGVPNRRALEQALAREWQRCGELRQPLAVVMIDVDFFKQYNDRHGHLEGDQQLRRVAQELLREVHPVRELLARFGGEEFAAVLPGLHLEEAAHRAEAMRRRFSARGEPLTLSLGVAAQVPGADGDPQQLLRRADTALYRAKRRGRNRVEVAED